MITVRCSVGTVAKPLSYSYINVMTYVSIFVHYGHQDIWVALVCRSSFY